MRLHKNFDPVVYSLHLNEFIDRPIYNFWLVKNNASPVSGHQSHALLSK